MTFFGEEHGLLGSRYYARHPVFPLAQTVADLNLEQLGRTDSTEGPKVETGNFTGFDFSDLPEIFKAAGEKTGIHIVDDKDHGDDYFAASDNVNLALAGVPTHTFSVTYEFPDYHGVGDEWYKIDYENMAKVDRMLAAGILDLAGRPETPKWNEANPKTERYVKAWKELEGR
jgi:Zn-dependent M28 family amino/carboxypeptidase